MNNVTSSTSTNVKNSDIRKLYNPCIKNKYTKIV